MTVEQIIYRKSYFIDEKDPDLNEITETLYYGKLLYIENDIMYFENVERTILRADGRFATILLGNMNFEKNKYNLHYN